MYVSASTDRLVLEGGAEGALGDEERQVVLLHAVLGLKHREIAQNLSLPLSTVFSRYHRAIKKLKRYLTEEVVEGYIAGRRAGLPTPEANVKWWGQLGKEGCLGTGFVLFFIKRVFLNMVKRPERLKGSTAQLRLRRFAA